MTELALEVTANPVLFYEVQCVICGAGFFSEHDTANVCSPTCCRARERRREKAKRARRRARLASENAVMPTKTMKQILQIIDRDGDRCAICNKPVNLDIVDGLHPKAPSRDHKVPRSRGGKNTVQNMQLAHRICNIKRGNKPLKVQ